VSDEHKNVTRDDLIIMFTNFTGLKKYTIFIDATLLKCHESRGFHFSFYVIIKQIQN
jgi:hypothetical protein